MKVLSGDRWETETRDYFGATVLHRRLPFADPALSSRSIFIYFRPDHSRLYSEFRPDDPWVIAGKELVAQEAFPPPEVDTPDSVDARVFDTYRLVLGIAQMCGNEGFRDLVMERLLLDTAELRDAQSIEPDGLVLRALVEQLTKSGTFKFRNVRLRDIGETVWRNHRVSVLPQQVGSLMRGLGFQTRNSHGVTVVAPCPATLIRACEEIGYSEDIVSDLKTELLNQGETR